LISRLVFCFVNLVREECETFRGLESHERIEQAKKIDEEVY